MFSFYRLLSFLFNLSNHRTNSFCSHSFQTTGYTSRLATRHTVLIHRNYWPIHVYENSNILHIFTLTILTCHILTFHILSLDFSNAFPHSHTEQYPLISQMCKEKNGGKFPKLIFSLRFIIQPPSRIKWVELFCYCFSSCYIYI